MKNWDNGIGEKTKAVFVEKKARGQTLDEFKQGIRNASMRIRGIDVCPDCKNISEDCICVL